MDIQEINELQATAEESEARQWLLTYADMVTLLLTFFVMLLAISSLDKTQFEQIMSSIQYSLGSNVAKEGRLGRIDVHDTRRQSLSRPTGSENEPLLKDLRQTVQLKNLDDMVSVTPDGSKIIIRVKGRAMFDSASARLKPEANRVLDEIAKIVKMYPGYRLDVGGHTDSRPLKSGQFQSNWELSALRATAVLRYLVDQGVKPRSLTATGYAATDPLAPNTSEENMALNRRVEFVLEKETR